MSRTPRLRLLVPLVAGLGLTAAPADAHDNPTGGAAMPDPPAVKTLRCADGIAYACGQGERLTVRGEGLALVRTVTFLGAPGRSDDRGARPQRRASHRLTVRVPEDAAPGPVRVLAKVSSATQRSHPSRPLDVEPAAAPADAEPAPPPSGDAVFPIRGKYTYGTSDANRFGGGGRHQGQDIFADCGTPLVAAQDGKVERAGFEGAMGNHVVVSRPDGGSQVYMHLAGAPRVRTGDRVAAGQPLGAVGETGRASGCHLHFEVWNAPGWTRGRPIDPVPPLRGWEGR